MLLIWGWKARFKTLREGMFHCPSCGADRHYRLRQARRWFTFFWIPVIPLQQLGEFVECSSCQSSYNEGVLTLPTTAQLSDNLSIATRGLAVAMVTADGSVEPSERERAIELIRSSLGGEYDSGNFDADLEAFAGQDFEAFLGSLSGLLNDHGKESLVAACVELAAADGHIDDRELEIARRAGAALLMTPSHVRGILSDVFDRTD